MALRPYPTSLSMDVWTELLAVIEGAKKPDAHSLHCVEDGLAFGLGQAFPDPPTGTMTPAIATAAPMTKAQAVDLCRKMVAANGAMTAHAAALPSGLGWLQWVQLILQLLGPILGGIGGAGAAGS